MTRYAAFISYSHADGKTAQWLHRALETYRMPRALVGSESPFGPIPRRLPPLFRDRDELAASGDLGENLREALAESRFQIVMCSPKAARSKWVNEEILTFKRLHGESRCLALIVSGQPHAGGEDECLPAALRFRLGPDGELSDIPAEPIAADMRPGKDGRPLALLKLVAGLAGVRLDALVRRDAARKQRRLISITAVSLSIAVLTIGLAIYAESQRRVAVRQKLVADRSLDFLIGTFAVANPATENPKTITALSILNRASSRAGAELREEPAVSARLLRATGEIYLNLGLPREAERDLRAALAREPGQSEERARTLLQLALVAFKRGDLKDASASIEEAASAYSPRAAYAPELDAMVLEQRGMAAIVAGRYAASADYLSKAAQAYGQLPGDHRADLGRVWTNEGQSLDRVGRFADADRRYQAAVDAYTAVYGAAHVKTAMAIQNQALAHFERGQTAQALPLIRRTIAIYDRVLDHDHPNIGAALILMGRIRTAQGDPAGGVATLDRARALYERVYGPQSAVVGDVDFYAAEAEAARGATDRALDRLARTKSIYDINYGPDDPDQVELLSARARILARAGRKAEAAQDCTAAVTLKARLDETDVAAAVKALNCANM